MLILVPVRPPAQKGMKTSAAGFPVFPYAMLEKHTTGGVVRSALAVKSVYYTMKRAGITRDLAHFASKIFMVKARSWMMSRRLSGRMGSY